MQCAVKDLHWPPFESGFSLALWFSLDALSSARPAQPSHASRYILVLMLLSHNGSRFSLGIAKTGVLTLLCGTHNNVKTPVFPTTKTIVNIYHSLPTHSVFASRLCPDGIF